MAKKRMFSMDIIDTDMFLEMPSTTQLLYFHLSMRADDDGFVSSPKRIIRLIGASDDDMRILFSKQFVIPFDSGICVIRHWKIHNYIQKDRYHETIYREEKLMLEEDINGVYKLDTECTHDVSKMDTEVRLDKASLGKDSLDNKAAHEADEEKKNDKYSCIPDIISYLNVKAGKEYRATKSNQTVIKARLDEGFTKEDCLKVIDKKVASWRGSEWEKFLRPETLFGASKFQGYLNEAAIQKHNTASREGYGLDISKYQKLGGS